LKIYKLNTILQPSKIANSIHSKSFRLAYLCFALMILTNFSCSLKAQTVFQNQLVYADSLFEQGNYFDAITEYKRLLFFDGSKQYEFIANYKIAMSYKSGAKFDEAIKYFTLSALSSKTKKDLVESKFQIVRCNILRKTTKNAILLLNSFEKKKDFGNFFSKINYWRGWAYLFSGDFEDAEYYFSKVSFGKVLESLMLQVEKEKYSVTFAKIISYILPGAGQFYTGNYVSGVISFGWNALWGYLTLNSFASNRAFDGLAVGSLLWLRFYRGNIQNAESFAKIKNREITNRMLMQIQNNYKGIRP